MNTAASYYTVPGLKVAKNELLHAVSTAFNLNPEDLFAKDKKRNKVDARSVHMLIDITISKASYASAAKVFELDHSTAVYAMYKSRDLFKTDMKFRSNLCKAVELLNVDEHSRKMLFDFLKSNLKFSQIKEVNNG